MRVHEYVVCVLSWTSSKLSMIHSICQTFEMSDREGLNFQRAIENMRPATLLIEEQIE